VPLIEDVPITVRELCVDIALYRLAHNPLKQTDEMRRRYEDAIKFLERVADGKASIGLDTSGRGESVDQVADPMERTELLLRA
jgi:phage gp36-like protein